MINTRLLDKKQLYIVGVSGGNDSMALLDMLNDYNLIVCHVNYHYREDSDIDQAIVENYCEIHNIKCCVLELFEHSDGNFQTNARNQRYDFYKSIGEEYGTNKVILGHHLNDVIENIYMQIERKNTKGYLGIQEISIIKGLTIIRPLLNVYKRDLLNYCITNKIEYHDDYTNFMSEFTRDYVRNEVLKDYDEHKINELLTYANRHNERIKKLDDDMKKYYDLYDKRNKIDYTQFSDEQLFSLIYYMLKKIMYPPDISESLINELIKNIHSPKPNIIINIGVNMVFIKEYDNVYTSLRDNDVLYQYVFENIHYDKYNEFTINDTGHLNEGIYLRKEDFPITIRNFIPGDKMITSGGTKKISRLFIDNKIPVSERKKWPIVVRKDGAIILVPHIAKNNEYLYSKPNVYVIK